MYIKIKHVLSYGGMSKQDILLDAKHNWMNKQ